MSSCVQCTSNIPALKSLKEVGYPLNQALGKGTYGAVETYMSITTGKKVAVKTMISKYVTDELRPDVIREISTLVSLNPHPDIIGLYAFLVETPAVVLELGMASLRDLLQDNLIGDTSRFEARSVIFQVLRAVAYMNNQDIWHRDIKPGNIIVTQFRPHIKVKLADFGISRSGPWCGITHTEAMYTLWYRSPEILIGEYFEGMIPQYNESAEVWAIGIVMWEMISAGLGEYEQYLLRARKNDASVQLKALVNGLGREKFLYTADNSQFLDSMIGTVQGNSGQILDSINSPNTKDLLKKMLDPNPETRISVFDALKHPFFRQIEPFVQKKFYKGEEAVIKETGPCQRYLKLVEEESTRSTGDCVSVLPGMTSLEKMQNYTFVVNRVLRFVLQTAKKSNEYLLTFSLGIYLLKCVLSKPAKPGQSYTVKELTKTALACIGIASKYHYKRPVSIMSAAALIGEENAKQLSDLEKKIFQQVGGKVHLPTSYRILIELIGCPKNEDDSSLRLYAWSVGILVALEQTQAAFVGKPSELARLAIHIVAHYFQLDTSKGKGPTKCFTKYGVMPTKDIRTGSDLAYSSLALMHPDSLADLVDDIDFIIKIIAKKESSYLIVDKLTPERFLKIIKGEIHTAYQYPDIDETESEEEDASTKKRSRYDEELELSDVEDDDGGNVLTSAVNNIYKGISRMFY